MENKKILKSKEPTEEQIRKYMKDNNENYYNAREVLRRQKNLIKGK